MAPTYSPAFAFPSVRNTQIRLAVYCMVMVMLLFVLGWTALPRASAATFDLFHSVANSSPVRLPPTFAHPMVDRWQPYIAEAAQRFGVPQDWVRAVIFAESSGRTAAAGKPIASPKGAEGLMQVMGPTYKDLSKRHGLGPDAHDPRNNIMAGTAYIAEMYKRFGYPMAFAAYNAGPTRAAEYVREGKPLPAETRDYLDRVTSKASGRMVARLWN